MVYCGATRKYMGKLEISYIHWCMMRHAIFQGFRAILALNLEMEQYLRPKEFCPSE